MDYLRQQIRFGIRAAQRGVIANSILGFIKIITGLVGNSYALIADGVESIADIFLSLVVWRGLHVSGKEATEDYHFGFGKAEPLGAAIVGVALVGAAVSLAIVSIEEIITPHHLPEWFTLPVLLLVIVIKEILARKTAELGKRLGSLSVSSDASHHRMDSITSLFAFIGIVVALIGGPGWEQSDDWAALGCVIVIAINGISILRRSGAELMDRAPDEEILSVVTNAASAIPEVTLVEKVLARKSGLTYFIAMHVHADPNMTLYDAHIVSGKVKSAVKKAIPAVKDVLVHMEPHLSEV